MGQYLLFLIHVHTPAHPCIPCFRNPCHRVEVVVSRSFWNLSCPFVGRELCMSMNGKKQAQEDLPKGKSSAFVPLLLLCAQMFPLWASSLHGAHWLHKHGKWLRVSEQSQTQRRGLPCTEHCWGQRRIHTGWGSGFCYAIGSELVI